MRVRRQTYLDINPPRPRRVHECIFGKDTLKILPLARVAVHRPALGQLAQFEALECKVVGPIVAVCGAWPRTCRQSVEV